MKIAFNKITSPPPPVQCWLVRVDKIFATLFEGEGGDSQIIAIRLLKHSFQQTCLNTFGQGCSSPLIKSQQNSCRQFLLTIINQKMLELDEVVTKCFYASSFRVFKPAEQTSQKHL